MIDIPIGKAIMAVEVDFKNMPEGRCTKCAFNEICSRKTIACDKLNREDGKNVMFKIVDINSHCIDGTIREPIRRESDEQL